MGGRFEIFGGAVRAVFTELSPQRIALDWHFNSWKEGVVSKVQPCVCYVCCSAPVLLLKPGRLRLRPVVCCEGSRLLGATAQQTALPLLTQVVISLEEPSEGSTVLRLSHRGIPREDKFGGDAVGDCAGAAGASRSCTGSVLCLAMGCSCCHLLGGCA